MLYSYRQSTLPPISADFASEDSPFHHSCISLTWRRLLCSWYRVAMAAVTLLPLALLVAIEIKFAESHDRYRLVLCLSN